MINSDTQIDEALLLRYFEGEVTLSEKEEIEKWIISSEANKKLAKQIYYLSFATKTMDTLKRTDARAALKEVRGRIRRERQLRMGAMGTACRCYSCHTFATVYFVFMDEW